MIQHTTPRKSMALPKVMASWMTKAASEAVSVGQLVSQLGQFRDLIPKLKWVEDDGMSLKEAFPKMLEMIWSQGLLITTFVRRMDLLAQLQQDNGDASESETPPELKSVWTAFRNKFYLYAVELLTVIANSVAHCWKAEALHVNEVSMMTCVSQTIKLLVWCKAAAVFLDLEARGFKY